jgi:hypothetical protein
LRIANGSRTSKQYGRTGNCPRVCDFHSKMRHYWITMTTRFTTFML